MMLRLWIEPQQVAVVGEGAGPAAAVEVGRWARWRRRRKRCGCRRRSALRSGLRAWSVKRDGALATHSSDQAAVEAHAARPALDVGAGALQQDASASSSRNSRPWSSRMRSEVSWMRLELLGAQHLDRLVGIAVGGATAAAGCLHPCCAAGDGVAPPVPSSETFCNRSAPNWPRGRHDWHRRPKRGSGFWL